MICVVCKKKFKDTFQHLTGKSKGIFRYKDKAHADYMRMIELTNYERPCFCGGHISNRAVGPESWDTTCDNCDFLYDED